MRKRGRMSRKYPRERKVFGKDRIKGGPHIKRNALVSKLYEEANLSRVTDGKPVKSDCLRVQRTDESSPSGRGNW